MAKLKPTMFDDGRCKVYRKVFGTTAGGRPTVTGLEPHDTPYYGDINFSNQELYSAHQSGTRVDRRIRVRRDRAIGDKFAVEIDGEQYDVVRAADRYTSGIACTDITLAKIEAKYEVKVSEGGDGSGGA